MAVAQNPTQCCDQLVECSFCTSNTAPAIVQFTLPTLTNAGSGCGLCATHSGAIKDGLYVPSCTWGDLDGCGDGPGELPTEVVSWSIHFGIIGVDTVAVINVRTDYVGGGFSYKQWVVVVAMGESTVNCSGLSITAGAGDVTGNSSGGPCTIGDNVFVQFPI